MRSQILQFWDGLPPKEKKSLQFAGVGWQITICHDKAVLFKTFLFISHITCSMSSGSVILYALKPLSANPTKWSNTLNQITSKLLYRNETKYSRMDQAKFVEDSL